MVTVAPVACSTTWLQLASDPKDEASDKGVEALVVPGAIWNLIVATTPLPMEVVLIPDIRQRMSPEEMALQAADFPAALFPTRE